MGSSRWNRLLGRLRAVTEWAAWLAHSPMSGFWLITAVLAAATGVELIVAPKHALDVLAALGTIVGVTEVTARFRGVAAWPTRWAHEVLESAGDNLLDNGEKDALESGEPTIGAISADRDAD
jgi:hypothetical protein